MTHLGLLLRLYALKCQTGIYKIVAPYLLHIALMSGVLLGVYCGYHTYQWATNLSEASWLYWLFIKSRGPYAGAAFLGVAAGLMVLCNFLVLFKVFIFCTDELQQNTIGKIPQLEEQNMTARQRAHIQAEQSYLQKELQTITGSGSMGYITPATVPQKVKKVHKI